MQPQEKYCIESTTKVAEPDPGSHGENLDFGGEGDEEDKEGGRAEEEEERCHEYDGWVRRSTHC